MAKGKEQEDIKLRYGLAIKKLIEKNKKINISNTKKGVIEKKLDDSYSSIYTSTGLRTATISAIINGGSEIKGYTLYQILTSLQVSFAKFGKVFDTITDKEIADYKDEIMRAKKIKKY
ncbi:MAG: hypothetical protein KGZ74_03005 [Chitinophagaceae bacterium]|nr:hypothetical protein [Chitinophagaceae bacterium]